MTATGSPVSSSNVLAAALIGQSATSGVAAPVTDNVAAGNPAGPPTAAPAIPTQTVVTEAVIDPRLLGVVIPGPQSPAPLDNFLSMVKSLQGRATYTFSLLVFRFLTVAISLARIAELEGELQVAQGTQGGGTVPTIHSIPRPKGTAGDDYNLQDAMGLKNDPVLYAQIRVSM